MLVILLSHAHEFLQELLFGNLLAVYQLLEQGIENLDLVVLPMTLLPVKRASRAEIIQERIGLCKAVVTSPLVLMHAHRMGFHLFHLVDTVGGDVGHALVVPLADEHGVAGAHEGGREDVLADGAADVVVADVLLVLVERDHLGQDLLGHLVDRREGERSDRDLDICQAPYDRLHLAVIYAVEGLDHHQIVFLLCVFENGRFDGGKVLLIRQVDVVQQGALSRQESAGELKALRVPELGLFLLRGCVKRSILLHLDDEANLGAVAEIGDGESADLLDEGLTGELELVLTLLDEVLELVGLQLHDAAD